MGSTRTDSHSDRRVKHFVVGSQEVPSFALLYKNRIFNNDGFAVPTTVQRTTSDFRKLPSSKELHYQPNPPLYQLHPSNQFQEDAHKLLHRNFGGKIPYHSIIMYLPK